MLIPLFWSCSSTQQGAQGEEGLETSEEEEAANVEGGDYNYGEEGGDDYSADYGAEGGDNYAAEGDNYGDNYAAEGGNYGDNYATEGGTNGEDVNSAEDEFADGAFNGGNGAYNTYGGNTSYGDQTASTGGEGINNAEDETLAGMEATPTSYEGTAATDTSIPGATPATAPATYTPGGMVKYVLPGGADLYNSPNSGSVVGRLEQGDHPLVWEENQWARTSDGLYIPSANLTIEAVGRAKKPSSWQ
jgi:hypothetical protein